MIWLHNYFFDYNFNNQQILKAPENLDIFNYLIKLSNTTELELEEDKINSTFLIKALSKDKIKEESKKFYNTNIDNYEIVKRIIIFDNDNHMKNMGLEITEYISDHINSESENLKSYSKVDNVYHLSDSRKYWVGCPVLLERKFIGIITILFYGVAH